MGLLKKYQKQKYRYENGDLFVSYPTKEQEEEFKNMIIENSKISNGEIQATYGMNMIRCLLRELTSIGVEVDEYNDDELSDMLDNGTRELNILLEEAIHILEEISEKIVKEYRRDLKYFNDMVDAVDFNTDVQKATKKFNAFAKKYKLGITFEDIINGKIKQEELENKLKEVK